MLISKMTVRPVSVIYVLQYIINRKKPLSIVSLPDVMGHKITIYNYDTYPQWSIKFL